MANGDEQLKTAEIELGAIKTVVETLKDMDDDSKRRVLGYAANLFGVNEAQRVPTPMVPPMPAQMGPRVRSTPIPQNVDPRGLRQAVSNAGLPNSGG